MFRIVCAILAIVALAAAPAFAQCNSANGQCGAPSVNSLSQQAQLLQAQLNNGVASSSASASTVAPAATLAAPAPQLVYQQYAAPAYAYGAYSGAVHPSQIVIAMPAPMQLTPAPAPEGVAVQAQQVAPLYQFATFQAPVAAAGGASAAASASAGGGASALAPLAVNPGLASASVGGCASGNCSARAGGGVLARLGAALRPARRSSSRSVSISRSRVR